MSLESTHILLNNESTNLKNKKLFNQILFNNFLSLFTIAVIWNALSFWVYLETNSLIITSIMAGLFGLFSLVTGLIWGILVDKYSNKVMMLASSIGSLVSFIIATLAYYSFGKSTLGISVLIGMVLIGVIFGNIRNIVLPTTVTTLFEENDRDKANGLVGIITGLSFTFSSVVSGLVIGYIGINGLLWSVIVITAITIIHTLSLSLVDKIKDQSNVKNKLFSIPEIKKTFQLITQIPGLFAIILFATINNLLAGVFSALVDPYGLSLVSVQTWGIVGIFFGLAFIIGGLLITKYGLGRSAIKAFFIANIISWIAASFIGLVSSIWLTLFCAMIYAIVAPVIEASEQTILQKIVPLEKQGSVFGFASSFESIASPISAFLVGPITQIIVAPFISRGFGELYIGRWFGTSQPRAIALVFFITGVIGIIFTLIAWRSRAAKILNS